MKGGVLGDVVNNYHGKNRPINRSRLVNFANLGRTILWGGVFLLSLSEIRSIQGAEVPRGQIEVFGMGPILEDLMKAWGQNPEKVQTMGDEPIVGRQVCPPLTRLNLIQKRSEPVLLAQLVETYHGEGGKDLGVGPQWSFTLKSGLAWWGGDPVSLDELQSFVDKTLPAAVRSIGMGLWEIPSYKIQRKEPLTIEIQWESAPLFGPYVMNGYSFFRQHPQKKVPECAGLYRPELKPWGLQLTATPGYRFDRPIPEISLYVQSRESKGSDQTQRSPSNTEKGWIEFSGIWNRNDNKKCHAEVPEPFVTALIWNEKKGVTSDLQLRRLLGQLIPREAMTAIIGSQYVSSDVSIVPKGHPHRLLQVGTRDAGLSSISSGLSQAGYLRPDPMGPRLDKGGQPIELSLVTSSPKNGLVEKVLGDVFSSVGIKVNFETQKQDFDPMNGNHNGFLGTMAIDWPGVNLLGELHQKLRKVSVLAGIIGTEDLDQHLERFALALTTKAPDFRDFMAIQQFLKDREGITVLFHYKSCLTLSPNMVGNVNVLAARNPDWFRQLIFVQ